MSLKAVVVLCWTLCVSIQWTVVAIERDYVEPVDNDWPLIITAEGVNTSAILIRWLPSESFEGSVVNYMLSLRYIDRDGNLKKRQTTVAPSEHNFTARNLPRATVIYGTLKTFVNLGTDGSMIQQEGIGQTFETMTLPDPNRPLILTAETINSSAIRISWRPSEGFEGNVDHYVLNLRYFDNHGSMQKRETVIEPSEHSFTASNLPNSTVINAEVLTFVKRGHKNSVVQQGVMGQNVETMTLPAGRALAILQVNTNSWNNVTVIVQNPSKHIPTYLRVVEMVNQGLNTTTIDEVKVYEVPLTNLKANRTYAIAFAISFFYPITDLDSFQECFSDPVFITTRLAEDPIIRYGTEQPEPTSSSGSTFAISCLLTPLLVVMLYM